MKIVFWDWNGTLVNDAPVLWQSFNDMVVPRGGAAVSFDRYREMYRHPIRDMYTEVGVDLDKHAFEEIASEWHERYNTLTGAMQLHHDAVEALSALQVRGSRQMVVSALPHDFLGSQVRQFRVGHFFEQIRGVADQLAHSKVAQARELAERVGADGGDITVIGDSSHDAEVAKELGASCILVARGAESRSRLEAHGHKVLEDFRELIASLSI
jgi:phosphoglycolate phosphatase